MELNTWLENDRFGMFIHWGLYSLGARHEWLQKLEAIHPDKYQEYMKKFNPDLYDPTLWAKAANNAGMKFFCITTKHHDGFCLWDSKYTDFKATNTPYGKDVLKPMVSAFNNEGLKTGLYYSLIDWHHPDFVIDSVHPLSSHPDKSQMNKSRDQKRYIQYMYNQVRELLELYDPVDMLFFDFSYPNWFAWPPNLEHQWVGKDRTDWGSIELLKMIRKIQPRVLINERLDLNDVQDGWDFRTPEQFEPRQWLEYNGKRVPWVTIHTFSGSWGYFRDETSWKSVSQLIQTLINVVSKGGSLLLNVGPTGRGEFDERAIDRLNGIGQWMRQHCRSIYGCTAAPEAFESPEHCVYTYNPKTNRLYLHIYTWPTTHLHLEGMAQKVEYAQFLHDASQICLEADELVAHQIGGSINKNTLMLTLPTIKPNVAVPVIELFLKT